MVRPVVDKMFFNFDKVDSWEGQALMKNSSTFTTKQAAECYLFVTSIVALVCKARVSQLHYLRSH